ncbi:MAG: ATP-binding protein, partial [Deltaproteobacteria bacterium]|nr:ATP-binding protein [Deltaproteobacteria bacterium]
MMIEIYNKSFNITGPCVPGEHYMLPAAERLAEVDSLIANRRYFVLHAPRQSGKTTTIQACVDKINDEGKYYAVYCSLEAAGVWTEPDEGIRKVGIGLITAMLDSGIPPLAGAAADAARGMSASGQEGALQAFLTPYDSSILIESILKSVCSSLDKDLVLFFDEADSLAGGLLIAFLRQLRAGYISRAKLPFPRTIALIGMRNIRDYKNKARPDAETSGSASPFNIVAKALSLKDFTFSEMSALYRQHTEERGQVFEESALEAAWRWSEGQPWIVNALAREVIEEQLHKDYSVPITSLHVDKAAETIITRRDTH